MPSYSIRTVRSFAASHQLRFPDGSLEPMHGHNWKVAVTVAAGRLDALGCVMDFHELERLVDAVVVPLHNHHLNELPPFDVELNPSAENVAVHVARSVGPGLPADVRLVKVRVWETAGNSAEYRPDAARPRLPVEPPTSGTACDRCGKPATVHLTQLHDGELVESHLCDACAAADVVQADSPHKPINELLAELRRKAADAAGT